MQSVGTSVIADRLTALGGQNPLVVVSGNFATPWELVRLADASLPICRTFVLNPQGYGRAGKASSFKRRSSGRGHGTIPESSTSRCGCRWSHACSTRCGNRTSPSSTRHLLGTERCLSGIEVDILPAAIERVRQRGGLIIAQVNRYMPYTGADAEIDVTDIDLALEVDSAPPIPDSRSTGRCVRWHRRAGGSPMPTTVGTVNWASARCPTSPPNTCARSAIWGVVGDGE